MEGNFKFKYFEVSHHRSTMKVGTDAVVLGSWLKVEPHCKRILDIGTGSGIIALMLAQKTNATIDAIDIDEASVNEATKNFDNSPWNERLRAIHCPLEKYFPSLEIKYDLIVSNPPFFQNSLLPKDQRLQLAKHNVALSINDFVADVDRLLHPDGTWAVIMPEETGKQISAIALEKNFALIRRLYILPKPEKPAKRIVYEFSKNRLTSSETASIVLREADGKYTEAYKKLTLEYHGAMIE